MDAEAVQQTSYRAVVEWMDLGVEFTGRTSPQGGPECQLERGLRRVPGSILQTFAVHKRYQLSARTGKTSRVTLCTAIVTLLESVRF